jgi:chaperonin GroES
MKLVPTCDRVVLRKSSPEDEVSKGGIVLTTTVEPSILTGEVLAVGPGRVLDSGTLLKVDLEVGQKVVFDKRHCVEVKHEGETYLVALADQILAKLS